ncbi:MAG: Fic family protein [Nitrospirota bacterium]
MVNRKQYNRYGTSDVIEAQYEPGSYGHVLKNKLGIKRKREMDEAESAALKVALDTLLGMYDENHCFTEEDIRKTHKIWLGNIYEWAGKYRQVKLSKGGFTFAFPAQVPKLMDDFEQDFLRAYTPCKFRSSEQIIKALAIIHTELVLIHPFREGNGRVARILATLMALQAGLPPLDFSWIVGKKKKEYIAAIQAGMSHNYRPMEKIFASVIHITLRAR